MWYVMEKELDRELLFLKTLLIVSLFWTTGWGVISKTRGRSYLVTQNNHIGSSALGSSPATPMAGSTRPFNGITQLDLGLELLTVIFH
jgi:hypothetical protein